jgi:hypothetical protein
MKLLLITITAVVFILSSCEKPLITDREETKQQTNPSEFKNDTIANKDTIHGTLPTQLIYTVSEAMNVNPADTPIIIKGYIVGATSRSIQNAQFSAPFTYTSNILIMDTPNTNGFDLNAVNIMPIKISDDTYTKKTLNLKDHPEYLNHQITLYGFRKEYLHSAGLVNILSFSIETSAK